MNNYKRMLTLSPALTTANFIEAKNVFLKHQSFYVMVLMAIRTKVLNECFLAVYNYSLRIKNAHATSCNC